MGLLQNLTNYTATATISLYYFGTAQQKDAAANQILSREVAVEGAKVLTFSAEQAMRDVNGLVRKSM